jgi:hypothetical protein
MESRLKFLLIRINYKVGVAVIRIMQKEMNTISTSIKKVCLMTLLCKVPISRPMLLSFIKRDMNLYRMKNIYTSVK